METATAVQYDYIPCEHARMLSLDSRKKYLKDDTTELRVEEF
jgi:hypothetical protein